MAEKTLKTRIQLKYSTTSEWTTANPVLKAGEVGLEVDTDNNVRAKVGDGTKTWSNLPYLGSDAKKVGYTFDTDGSIAVSVYDAITSLQSQITNNQNAIKNFSTITAGGTNITADNSTDTLTIVAGNNVTVTGDATNDKITIAAQDTHHTAKNVVANSATGTTSATSGTSNTTTFLNLVENGAVRSDVQIKGAGATTVSAINDVITITSTDNNTWRPVKAGGNTLENSETLEFVEGTNIDITEDGGKVTIKNTYSLPAAGSDLGGVKTGGDVTISSGIITVNGDSHNHVIGNVDGLTDRLNTIDSTLATKAPLASPALTGTPTAPTAGATTNTTQIATTAFVQSVVNNKIAASNAMVFKGTLGTGGTVTALPTNAEAGHTYKVITAGTYGGVAATVGDLYIALKDNPTNDAAGWAHIDVNEEGHVVGPASAVDVRVAVFDGTTGKLIKDSGFTIGKSVPADAKFTDNNGYHTTGSWSGVTYTATANGGAGELKFTVPTATSSALGVVKPGTNTSISNGAISVADGTTSAKGVVQLSSSTSSTSTTLAATPSAVKAAYDLANSALTKATEATHTLTANNTFDSNKPSGVKVSGEYNVEIDEDTTFVLYGGTATDVM